MSELLGASSAASTAATTAAPIAEASGSIAANPALSVAPVAAEMTSVAPVAAETTSVPSDVFRGVPRTGPTDTQAPPRTWYQQVGDVATSKDTGDAMRLVAQLAQMGASQRGPAIPPPSAGIQLQRGMPMALMQPSGANPVSRGGGGMGGASLLQLLAMLGGGRR